MSLNRIMSLVKNLPTRWRETEEKNWNKGLIDKKPPNQWEGLERKTKKSWWKIFQSGLRTEKKKPRIIEKRGVIFEAFLKRDLDDKGLGQNKVLYSFSRVKLPMVNYHTGSPTLLTQVRQISGYPPTFGSRITLTRILPCRLFLVASLGASISASWCASWRVLLVVLVSAW